MSPRRSAATRAARAGLATPQPGTGDDLIPAISLASVRAFADLDAMGAAMEGRQAYRRYGSDPVTRLEAVVADLEAVEGREPPLARATASGQAALLLATTLVTTASRRRIVVVRPCYGGTDALIAGPLGNLGLRLTTVDLTDDTAAAGEEVRAVLDTDVALVVTEVVTNPLMRVVDIPAVVAAAHDAGAACLVDSTFTPAFLFQPFAHGADLTLHSLTKHLSGHSDVLGGILLADAESEAAGWLDAHARLGGVALAPFDAWLALRGIRTAALRIQRSTENAAALAAWFAGIPAVRAVHFPGTHGDAEAALVSRLLPHGVGPMLSIDVGSRAAAASFFQRLDGVRCAPSLGDVATTVSHPASTSHRALSAEQRERLGITEGLVRISTGVETLDDLRAEFATALGSL